MEFGAGMLGAWYIVTHPYVATWISRSSAVAPVLALAFLLSLGSWQPPDFLGVAIWAITIGFTLIGCAVPGTWYRPPLEWPPLCFLGLISFSFYLIHQPTIYYLSQLADRVNVHGYFNWGVQLSLGFIIVILLAMLGFALFEQPFLGTRPVGAEARLLSKFNLRARLLRHKIDPARQSGMKDMG